MTSLFLTMDGVRYRFDVETHPLKPRGLILKTEQSIPEKVMVELREMMDKPAREWFRRMAEEDQRGQYAVNLQPKGEAKMGEKIQLGQKVKDSITGFVGTVTARCEYVTSPVHVLVEGIDSTGRPIERWFEESRMQVQG